MSPAVEALYSEAQRTVGVLEGAGELSLKVWAADHFRKALLLAAASYFEHRLRYFLREFVRDNVRGSDLIPNFLNRVIARQYHSWFTWEDDPKVRHANAFFSMFGENFKLAMTEQIKASEEVELSVLAFLEIGHERNRLVHNDYAAFPMEKTLGEIYEQYRKGDQFLDLLLRTFRECNESAYL